MELRRRRAYDSASPDDGFRVLVDRLWPRGVSKERAAIDLWAKDVAPTTELRREWHAPGADFDASAQHYRAQLEGESAGALAALVDELRGRPVVTLVYAVNDTERNHAIVLEDVLRSLLD
ncbi:DUF488 domain-containing protein [Microbacterium esteraromaticum]|uniref:DUF488 domain-containing protein n=1 Tax=Microbacterium esteraromaticum TaxID=57043 RepID=UPI00195A2B41|nr:DUF488 family protein [Microbacterium esteraromaticum]MBM7465743.1 uncharacterized protein YeaO (DUF488 family) [Microbacterium esteraromaticum]